MEQKDVCITHEVENGRLEIIYNELEGKETFETNDFEITFKFYYELFKVFELTANYEYLINSNKLFEFDLDILFQIIKDTPEVIVNEDEALINFNFTFFNKKYKIEFKLLVESIEGIEESNELLKREICQLKKDVLVLENKLNEKDKEINEKHDEINVIFELLISNKLNHLFNNIENYKKLKKYINFEDKSIERNIYYFFPFKFYEEDQECFNELFNSIIDMIISNDNNLNFWERVTKFGNKELIRCIINKEIPRGGIREDLEEIFKGIKISKETWGKNRNLSDEKRFIKLQQFDEQRDIVTWFMKIL